MATRFYFPSSGVAALPALGFDSGWTDTAAADRRPLVTAKSNTALADRTRTSTASPTEPHLVAQFQSSRLASQTFGGTVKGQWRGSGTNTFGGANWRTRIAIYVVTPTGTLRAALVAAVGPSATTTPPVLAGSSTNRKFLSGTVSAIPVAAVSCYAGDILVVEIGVRDSTINAETATMRTGDPSATADLPEDDTTTTDLVPWIEFSQTVQLVVPYTGRSKFYALGGVARGGVTRAGYVQPQAYVAIDGVPYVAGADPTERILNDTLAISEVTDETPNTCRFTTKGFRPANGANVVITLGSKNRLKRLFAGTVLAADYNSVGIPSNARYPISVIDYAWQLTWVRVRKRYTNLSVTAIALDLMTFAPPGFDGQYVEAGLPVLEEFTVTNEDLMTALVRLAARIQTRPKIDYYKHLHLGFTDTSATNPRTLTTSLSTLSIESVRTHWAIDQIVTRVEIEGGGVNAVAEVSPGETVLPVDDVAWYEDPAGQVVSGPQTISYSRLHHGGAGSLAGPGVSPSSPPTLALVAGAGLGAGVYKYEYTDVTALGETSPSPLGTITTGGNVLAPTSAMTGGFSNAGGGPYPFNTGDAIRYWAYTITTAAGETLPSPLFAPAIPYPIAGTGPFLASFTLPLGPAGTTGRKIYRTTAGGAQLKLVGTVADNTTTAYTDHTTDGALGANVPTSSTAGTYNQVNVSAIAIGPARTTARKIYRTAVDASQPKLLATLANNTATTLGIDSAADGTLGANAPAGDTSGLTREDGQINPGSTTLQLNSLALADAAGGWVTDGWQFIRYAGTAVLPVTLAIAITRSGATATAVAGSATGFVTGQTITVSGATQPEYNGSFVITSMAAGEGGTTFAYTVTGTPATPATGSPVVAIPGGNLLTGIPASGVGAIESPIWFGSTISAVPALAGIPASGVGAIVETIKQGDAVNALVTVDDLAAQAALAAVIGGGFNGVITEPLQDRRLSVAECRERGEAVLALRAPEEVGLAYESRDGNTAAGRPVVSDLPAPLPTGTFQIQSVEIDSFKPSVPPRYQVKAVITRFTFEALLRLARGRS